MSVNFSNTLIVAISATALFDLTHLEITLNELIKKDPKTAQQKFAEFVQTHENEPLNKGSGYPLVKALLNLNQYQDKKDYQDESPLVEVVVISKSTPDMGLSVLNAIRNHKLPITRSAFISGACVADYIGDFKVDLFLTTNTEDAQAVIDKQLCACAILDAIPIDNDSLDTDQLRIAFDGDAVLFDGSGELIYQTDGLKAFHDYENKMENSPIAKGPYADFLIKLSQLQSKLPQPPNQNTNKNPISIALVTARNAPADLRAIKTLRAWGVVVDMAFFLGGLEKTPILKTFAPHIFFDDSIKHITLAKSVVPSGLVPYHSQSELYDLSQKKYTKTPSRNNKKTSSKK